MSPYKGNRVTTTGQYIHAAPRDHTAAHATLCRPGGWLLPPTSEGKRLLALVWPSEKPVTCGKCLTAIGLAYDEARIIRSYIWAGIQDAAKLMRRWEVYFSENPYAHYTDEDLAELVLVRKKTFDEALTRKALDRLVKAGVALRKASRNLHELFNEQERRAQLSDVRPPSVERLFP